jgi:hypothetical protein
LYAFLYQSGQQHANLKVGLKDDFTTGDNRYPKNRQQTLHLLDNYSKTATPRMTPSEGRTSFVQRGGRGRSTGKGKGKPFDKERWKDKECHKCKKKGHPGWACPTEDDDGDEKIQKSQASSMKKLEKELKSIKKSFAQLQTMNESDSDISDSNESQGESHFQFDADGFQFTQVEHEFEPQTVKPFKQAWTTQKVRNDSKLAQAAVDLREVILLDSQSTMDLFCIRALVKKTFRSSKKMQLRGATVGPWWFPKRQRWRAITRTCGTTKRPSPISWLLATSSDSTVSLTIVTSKCLWSIESPRDAGKPNM